MLRSSPLLCAPNLELNPAFAILLLNHRSEPTGFSFDFASHMRALTQRGGVLF